MNKKITFSLTLVLIMAVFCNAYSDELKLIGENATIAETQKTFVERYIGIINSKEKESFEKIIHYSCLNWLKEHPDFFEEILKTKFRHTIPEGYSISIKDIPDSDPLPFESSFTYPIRPTHLIMLTYKKKESNSASIMIQAIEQNGEYFEIMPCPKQELLEKYKNK